MATFDTSMFRRNPLKSVAEYEYDLDKVDLQKQDLRKNKLAFQDRERALAEAETMRNVGKRATLVRLKVTASPPQRLLTRKPIRCNNWLLRESRPKRPLIW
jgi:hypothetical protein